MKLFTFLLLVFITLNATEVVAQDYSRLKIFANEQELQKLSNLGVTIDHGYL